MKPMRTFLSDRYVRNTLSPPSLGLEENTLLCRAWEDTKSCVGCLSVSLRVPPSLPMCCTASSLPSCSLRHFILLLPLFYKHLFFSLFLYSRFLSFLSCRDRIYVYGGVRDNGTANNELWSYSMSKLLL